MAHTYAPGTGYVVAAGDFLIFLPDNAKPDTLRALWRARDRVLGNGFLGVLSELTSSLDPTLENLPRFVVVELGVRSGSAREARVAVCGDVTALIQRENFPGPTTVHGAGAAMWLEERFTDVVSLRLSSQNIATATSSIPAPFTDLNPVASAEVEPDARMTVLLPLAEGIVHADAVTWEYELPASVPIVPVAESLSPEPVEIDSSDFDDDFGRTLAELPEEWYSEPSGSIADDVYEDSISAGSFLGARSVVPGNRDANVVFGGDSTDFAPTEVLQSVPADVIPTEVVGSPSATQVPAFPSSAASEPAPTVPISAMEAGAAGTKAFDPKRAAGVRRGVPRSVEGVLGRVRFSHGEVVELGVPLVIGRKPSHEGSGADPIARMVSVPSPSKDISRNHLMLHVEQGNVLATDLGSVNGSVLRRSGCEDADLDANIASLVISDDLIDLGDGVTLVFELDS